MSAESIENLLGKTIVNSNGDEIITSSLASKKQIILYFSAHWCPPCRGFTPLLSKAYEEYKQKFGDQAEVEVVFVSGDNDENSFKEYHKEMTFPAIPYDSVDELDLNAKFGIQGIPSLVAVDGNGEQINESIDFRSLIAAHGAEAFPLTPERVSKLEAAERLKAAQSLQDLYNGNVPFEVSIEAEIEQSKLSLEEVMSKTDNVGILLGDGDASDECYAVVKDVMDQLNKGKAKRCSIVYLGWSLYNDYSDHDEVSKKFDYSMNEIPEDVRIAVGYVVGKQLAQAPTLVILRRGTGLCGMDGKCEDANTPVLVSTDPGLQRIQKTGAEAFPWDEAAIKAFMAEKKAKVERLKSNLTDMKFLIEPEGVEGSVVLRKDHDKPLKEQLFVGDSEGVIGLYFSAHWCPPCQDFTPKLVECYEQVKASGKKFEIVFASSDSNKEEFEEYYESMKTGTGIQFLAIDYDKSDLKAALSNVFEVCGIPTLVLLKPDGTILSMDGVTAIMEGGAEAFPWDDATIKKVAEEKKEALLKKEKEIEAFQRASGNTVVKRLAGNPEDVLQDIKTKTVSLNLFSTVGAPDLFTESGVLYYELEIVKRGDCGNYPQFGFALKDGIDTCDTYTDIGVGDNKTSWGVDGDRSCKWFDGSTQCWTGEWDTGDVIGLAANIEKGLIAVSKNGNWTADGFGLAFEDETIKQGVYPCFTASTYTLKLGFDEASFKFEPPAESVWSSVKKSC